MASSGTTWRKHPFKLGEKYIAKESVLSYPKSEFTSGRTYEFHHVGYSHHDSATVFTFIEKGKTEPEYWWWFDSDDDDLCLKLFEKTT